MQTPAGNTAADTAAGATIVDPARVLAELSRRWRGAYGLEYRSEAVMAHQGEFQAVVRVHAWLRKPSMARLVFRCATFPEADRVRVCDGRQIWDRQIGARRGGGRGATIVSGLRRAGGVTQDISHPLDEAGYSAAQFFASAPWTPPAFWGGPGGKLQLSARRLRRAARDVFEITFARGVARDTLVLDAVSYAPVSLVRVAEHGGLVQEVLRETFVDVRLNPVLPPALFVWSPGDEAGRVEGAARR